VVTRRIGTNVDREQVTVRLLLVPQRVASWVGPSTSQARPRKRGMVRNTSPKAQGERPSNK
jgi:hypothetical protein